MGARKILDLGRRKQIFTDFTLSGCGVMDGALAGGKTETVPGYRLYFSYAGRGKISVNGAAYTIGRGDGLVVTPGQRVELQPEGEAEWSYFWVSFGGEKAAEGLRLVGLEDTASFRCAGCDALLALVKKMLGHGDGGPENEMLLQSLLFQFFASLAHQRVESGEMKGGRDNSYVQKAVDYIKSNYAAGITVNDVANYVSLNRSYLSTLFQRVLEVSPQDFLIYYRLSRAKELLLETEDTIANIALRCGYADPQVFTRAFKQQMGMTPANFRRAERQAAQQPKEEQETETVLEEAEGTAEAIPGEAGTELPRRSGFFMEIPGKDSF